MVGCTSDLTDETNTLHSVGKMKVSRKNTYDKFRSEREDRKLRFASRYFVWLNLNDED